MAYVVYVPFLLAMLLPSSVVASGALCVADTAGLVLGEPRARDGSVSGVDSLVPPGLEAVWHRAPLLPRPTLLRLRRAFDALDHRSFGRTDYGVAAGTNRSISAFDIRRGFLAGILEKGDAPSTYRFRQTVALGGWQTFDDYGESINSGYLRRARLRFGQEPFRNQDFMEEFGLGVGRAVRILDEGVLTGVLEKRGRKGATRYVFTASDPDGYGGSEVVVRLLEGSGTPANVWRRAPLLSEPVFARLKTVFEKVPPINPLAYRILQEWRGSRSSWRVLM